jgi:ABC-type dipeptide/oligopeptide/nickel transport system permease component
MMNRGDWPMQTNPEGALPKAKTGFFGRIMKYILVRLFSLALMLIFGMFLAVIVLNFGGYIDDIYRANIEESLMYMAAAMTDLSYEEKVEFMDRARFAMEEARGLHKPFILRCIRWTVDALRLRLGYTTSMVTSGQTVSVVEYLVKERLPYTLILFGVSNFLIFV